MYKRERNYGCRWSEWTTQGLRAVVLENRFLRVTILQDKGTDIYEFLYKPLDIDFMWRSPNRLSNPYKQLPLAVPENSFFLDYYQGGWQELFPNGGNACNYSGADLGQHGEVALLPWEKAVMIDDPEVVSIKFWVRTVKTPFYLEKEFTIREGESTLYIKEKLVNEGSTAVQYMWGHHPALGKPFLDENCVVELPGGTIITNNDEEESISRLKRNQREAWPYALDNDDNRVDLKRVLGEHSNYQDMCFLTDLPEGWYRVVNKQKNVGFQLKWDLKSFPHLWFWQEANTLKNYPWYGRAYCMALEPFSSKTPMLTEAIARGEADILNPGEVKETWLEACVYEELEGE